MALSDEEQLKLIEVERELAADRLLVWLFMVAFPVARPDNPTPVSARRMLCFRPQRRRR
jgi:hypothetical protein